MCIHWLLCLFDCRSNSQGTLEFIIGTFCWLSRATTAEVGCQLLLDTHHYSLLIWHRFFWTSRRPCVSHFQVIYGSKAPCHQVLAPQCRSLPRLNTHQGQRITNSLVTVHDCHSKRETVQMFWRIQTSMCVQHLCKMFDSRKSMNVGVFYLLFVCCTTRVKNSFLHLHHVIVVISHMTSSLHSLLATNIKCLLWIRFTHSIYVI